MLPTAGGGISPFSYRFWVEKEISERPCPHGRGGRDVSFRAWNAWLFSIGKIEKYIPSKQRKQPKQRQSNHDADTEYPSGPALRHLY